MNPIIELPSYIYSTIILVLLLVFVYLVYSLTPAATTPLDCLFCGNGKANNRCSRCKVARYCSETCRKKQWKVHMLKCICTSERRVTRDSDHHLRDRNDMSSTSTNSNMCLICDNRATHRCIRCTVAKYCSENCQIKHWRAGHKLECKEYKSPCNIGSALAVSSEGRGHRVDGALTKTTQPSKRNSGMEHRSVGECPICLTAICTNKHSRPSLSCEICKQKFHSHCISQWFSTSKKSSCPCCLSPFKSGGATVQSSNSSSK